MLPNFKAVVRRGFLRKTAALITLAWLAVGGEPGQAQEAGKAAFTNPILRGSFPDPSICRDGDNYYLVNSTFEYFPGLPVHHSKDLVNWTLIGHGLHREEQVTGAVNLVDVQSDGGIHAPTIRCGDGKFTIITTNVYQPPEEGAPTQFVNFVITADDPAGPWSMPTVIDDAPGIDPDLFFDDDGRAWYAGTHSPENPNFPGEGEIWLQEIDTDTWQLSGERYLLWRGACGGVWAEGPHLYKKDGRYYLLVAEGGTSFNHAVVVAVADDVTGPYTSNPRNPILTSRHLSYDYWINSTGHADLFQLPDGRWYMVTLGIRGDVARRSNMGRETHLVPVTWEREPFWWQDVKTDWPVASPDTGRVERHYPAPFAGTTQERASRFVDDFSGDALKPDWTFRRVPVAGSYSLSARPGYLRLYALPGIIRERGRASLVGVRQTESDFDYSAKVSFAPATDGAEAGLNLFQKDNNFLSFTLMRRDGSMFLQSTLSVSEQDAKITKSVEVLASRPLPDYDSSIVLRVVSTGDRYRLKYSVDGGARFEDFVETGAEHLLSRGYTGAYLGVYATANGSPSDDYADFDWVRVNVEERDASAR